MSETLKENGGLEVDFSYLREMASGSSEFMIEMIDVFLEQTPLYLGQLGEAVKEKDWKATGDIAHKIKPSLAFLGVEQARETMAEIERKARNQIAVETIEADLDYINSISPALYSRLNDYRKALETKI